MLFKKYVAIKVAAVDFNFLCFRKKLLTVVSESINDKSDFEFNCSKNETYCKEILFCLFYCSLILLRVIVTVSLAWLVARHPVHIKRLTHSH